GELRQRRAQRHHPGEREGQAAQDRGVDRGARARPRGARVRQEEGGCRELTPLHHPTTAPRPPPDRGGRPFAAAPAAATSSSGPRLRAAASPSRRGGPVTERELTTPVS